MTVVGDRRSRYIRSRTLVASCLLAPALLGMSACSSSGTSSGSGQSGAGSGKTGLAAVCPNPVKIATDWTPEAEQGAYYQLAATNGSISKGNKTYTAPLVDPNTGKQTNVNVELIAGGPAVGQIPTPSLLHQQPGILMGADDLDTAIADYSSAPVQGIVAPFTNSLHIIFWNPAKHHFTSFADLKKSNITVLYFKGTEFIEYLAGAGVISEGQLDGSYNGSPSRFVSTGGDVAAQGFATAEPYLYTHETAQWNKPIAYELTSTTGFNPYSEMGEATPANVKKYSACFKQLVPMIQQSQINYVKKPTAVNNLITKLNTAYGEIGGNYDLPVATYAVQTLLKDKIVAQPTNGAFGSFDPSRVTQLLSQLKPVLDKAGQSIGSLKPSDVYTNQYIDKSITFTGYSGPYNNTSGVITEPGTK